MTQINYLFIASLFTYASLQAAAHADPESAPRRIVTAHIPGTTTCSWWQDTNRVRRSIEDIAETIILINPASLPPHAHKVMTIASQPHCAQYLLLAMHDVALRDMMLQTVEPHLQAPLNLKKAYELFGTQVDSLKALSFFVALFTFSVERIGTCSTTLWMLEMGNEKIMLDPPLNSARDGFSRAYICDPSIFLINPRTLTWTNIHKRPGIMALIAPQTPDAQSRLAHAVKAFVETPEKPFGFKVRTNRAKLYLQPTYDASRMEPAPVHHDGCVGACTAL